MIRRKQGFSPRRKLRTGAAKSKKASNKRLLIKWQRLVARVNTCPRCGWTEKELDRAGALLKTALKPLKIRVVLEKKAVTLRRFKNDPSLSNRIWINGRLLEDWLEARVGESPCCDVCGESECRTLEISGRVYDAIPAEMIIKAGLMAASRLV